MIQESKVCRRSGTSKIHQQTELGRLFGEGVMWRDAFVKHVCVCGWRAFPTGIPRFWGFNAILRGHSATAAATATEMKGLMDLAFFCSMGNLISVRGCFEVGVEFGFKNSIVNG